MTNSINVINFPKKEFNQKCRNLESNGFELYLSTLEDGINHCIFTNTIHGNDFNGWIVDIFDNGKIEYSK